uniref:RASD family member 2 n=1 Tax=Sciurus vulgaris TaxID=55149 RepID=A0A8D2JMA1_SCIVU
AQPRAMMKTLSSGHCTLSVPAKNPTLHRVALPQRPLRGAVHPPPSRTSHRKVYNIRGDMYQLDILDTSGNHPFPAMRRLSILTGDVFILVFSLDNRESFDEVKRLQKQILEVKSCLKNKTKEAAELPMVICGNKNDHSELCRQVPTTEAELLVSGDENCAYFEVSAKKNTNVDEMFYVLFSMAKLPHEMSPALHRKISVQYGDAFHPRPFCMRRVKDTGAYGMVSPFAPPPQRHSDLKYIKAKVLREGPGPGEGQVHHPVRGRGAGRGAGSALREVGPRRSCGASPGAQQQSRSKACGPRPEVEGPSPVRSAPATSSSPLVRGFLATSSVGRPRHPGDRRQARSCQDPSGPKLEPSGPWVRRHADAREVASLPGQVTDRQTGVASRQCVRPAWCRAAGRTPGPAARACTHGSSWAPAAAGPRASACCGGRGASPPPPTGPRPSGPG